MGIYYQGFRLGGTHNNNNAIEGFPILWFRALGGGLWHFRLQGFSVSPRKSRILSLLYGFGYSVRGPPYTPDSIYLRGTIS